MNIEVHGICVQCFWIIALLCSGTQIVRAGETKMLTPLSATNSNPKVTGIQIEHSTTMAESLSQAVYGSTADKPNYTPERQRMLNQNQDVLDKVDHYGRKILNALQAQGEKQRKWWESMQNTIRHGFEKSVDTAYPIDKILSMERTLLKIIALNDARNLEIRNIANSILDISEQLQEIPSIKESLNELKALLLAEKSDKVVKPVQKPTKVSIRDHCNGIYDSIAALFCSNVESKTVNRVKRFLGRLHTACHAPGLETLRPLKRLQKTFEFRDMCST